MEKKAFMKIAEEKWPELKELKGLKSFYEYEKRFEELWLELGREVLEASISKPSEDHRVKKKIVSRFGIISIRNSHHFSKPLNGYKVSPYMQEQATFMSQLEVYQSAQVTMDKLLRVSISNSQLHRITNCYGLGLAEDMLSGPPPIEAKAEEFIYAQMDGSMLFTDDGWQEVKVGRIFSSGAIEKQSIGSKRRVIKASQYTAHLGNYNDFMSKFNKGLVHYHKLGKRLVFITDGATWMHNWLTKHYPNAQIILDYYHVIEHISSIGKVLISSNKEFKTWLTQLKGLVLTSKHSEIGKQIEKLSTTTPEQEADKQRLIRYLTKNQYRMDYLKYRQLGLQIGSGAIEAAHRTLVQARMKKSGQRWSEQGAKNMLNLRVAFKSNRWDLVMEKIWSPAA